MIQLLVMAKAPVPGRVKTRLCPPCTPAEAAAIAEASLADTLAIADQVPVVRRVAVLEGNYPAPAAWRRVAQRGEGLGERLAYAFADTALPGVPALLIGMDTPQITPALLARAAEALSRSGSVLGPAIDGGWWALGLRNPDDAQMLPHVPMSTPDTGALTLAALHARGVDPLLLPTLRDVDTAADAVAVASACPTTARFPSAVRRFLTAPAPATDGGASSGAPVTGGGDGVRALVADGGVGVEVPVVGGRIDAGVSGAGRLG
ncbi:TIGR04282 family arsenosugar biosynthesis glycosyltransferase [Actinoplanes sp. NPDC000266]